MCRSHKPPTIHNVWQFQDQIIQEENGRQENEGYQFYRAVFLWNGEHKFFVPHGIQVALHHSCLHSLRMKRNEINESTCILQIENTQNHKLADLSTCFPSFKTTYGSLESTSRTAKFVPLSTLTFSIPINSTMPS